MSDAHAVRPSWREVPAAAGGADSPSPPRRPIILIRSLLPGAVVSGLFLLLGHPVAAAAVALVATAVSVASALSARVRAGVERVLHVVGRAVGTGLSVALLFLVEMFVFAPLSFVLWLFRTDPLEYAATSGPAAWAPAPSDPAAHRPYAVDPPGPPPTRVRRVVRSVPRVVGWVALALVVDLAVGALVWVGSAESDGDRAAANLAAADDAPWFPEYLEELRSVRADFAPFVQSQQRDQAGRYINVNGGLRASYEPDRAAGALPLVLFFGGTNAWGEGQRDEHTIPSEVARLAEADGHPIRVLNLAQRGDVNFTAMLRFERALAGGAPAPDLAVFLDGPDDYLVQRQVRSGDPGQYGLADAQDAVVRDDRSLWERYAEASLLHRVVGRVQRLFAIQPAAAATGGGAAAPDLADDTAAVYERGRRLAHSMAERAGVPVRFFWLPIQAGADSPYAAATAALDPSVVDLSDSLADVDEPVYLDGAQINERGALLVAQAVYRELRPQLAALTPAG